MPKKPQTPPPEKLAPDLPEKLVTKTPPDPPDHLVKKLQPAAPETEKKTEE